MTSIDQGTPEIKKGRPAGARLGVFWFVPSPKGGARLIEASDPASDIPEVGGFKTYGSGHVDVWERILRQEPSLRGHPYEEFPRGRANWRAEDNAWLLLMDRTVMSPPFVAAISAAWTLPERTIVMSDSHYRSSQRVRPPIDGPS